MEGGDRRPDKVYHRNRSVGPPHKVTWSVGEPFTELGERQTGEA